MPMNIEQAERRAGANLERHIQTILISLITGAVIFAASYFFSDRAEKAVLVQQLSALNQQVAEMRGEIRAMQQNYVTKEEFKDHEQRLRFLEAGKPMNYGGKK